jgi:antitoxin ParD1/3/4
LRELWIKTLQYQLGEYFDNFIKNKISEGRYKNASEVVRAGLRLLEEEEKRISTLREVILEGMESGIAHDFKPDTQLEKIKAKKKPEWLIILLQIKQLKT